MTKHSEELQEAAVIAEKKIVKISLPASQLLAEKVISTFCSSSYRYPIWENLISYIGVTFPYSWDWFASLLSNKEVILFFEPTENDFAYVIINGAEIPDILNNSYRFTFYITDSESSFLFCYNDHDNLIASGEAIDWLRLFLDFNHPGTKIYTKLY